MKFEIPSTSSFIGIEIGGTKLQIVSGTEFGEILTKYRFDVNKEDGAAGIMSSVEKVLRRYQGKVSAIGVGFGGPVNWETGEVCTSFQIDGWSKVNLKHELEAIVQAPVFVENDANAAALGESCLGAGIGFNKILYVTIGSGLGGGFVYENNIFHGDFPGEIEIGHIRLDKNGTTLQDSCSGWAIDKQIREIIKREPGGVLAKIVGRDQRNESMHLLTAMNENDASAKSLFDAVVDNIAFGLSHAIHLLHPEVIILGGGFSLIGSILQSCIEKRLPKYVMYSFQPCPKICLAKLHEFAVPIGAIVLASQKLQTLKNQ
jgi:glucokinase